MKDREVAPAPGKCGELKQLSSIDNATITYKLYEVTATKSEFIDLLLRDPRKFRQEHCLDCKHHRVMYVCLKCRVTQAGFVYIYDRYAGRVAMPEEMV